MRGERSSGLLLFKKIKELIYAVVFGAYEFSLPLLQSLIKVLLEHHKHLASKVSWRFLLGAPKSCSLDFFSMLPNKIVILFIIQNDLFIERL